MGRRADEADAAIVKGMLIRGDRQHDIAAWFGVNAGRVAEIATGTKFANVAAVPPTTLPPPGPYLSGKQVHQLLGGLTSASIASSE
jgi:hypothetical protein